MNYEQRIRRLEQAMTKYQSWATDAQRRMFWLQVWLGILIVPPIVLVVLAATGQLSRLL